MKYLGYLLVFFTLRAYAQSSLPIKFGGFLDTYYAYDSNSPKNHERDYTTQPARHNEFNVNLAYLDAQFENEKTRSRLALQFGHSVTKNTIYEPQLGPTSGPQDQKIFQEAYIGKKIGEKTWIDAGIFLGHIGAESWISKNNWTYTRSLNLDYVPYYSSGLRLHHQMNTNQSLQLHLINGWQNMSENNNAKAIGMQYAHVLNNNFTFTYNNFFGDEQVVLNPKTKKFNSRFRGYHNFILKWEKSDRWQFLYSFDVGHQSQQNNNGLDAWIATTLTLRNVLTSTQAFAVRGEYYSDPHEANVMTRTPHGFQILGMSANYDQNIDQQTLWRTEIRGLKSKDAIYSSASTDKKKWDGILVTSLAFWF